MLDPTKTGIIFLFKVDNFSFFHGQFPFTTTEMQWLTPMLLLIWGYDRIIIIFLLCDICTSFVRRALETLLWFLLMMCHVHLTQHLLNHCHHFSINVQLKRHILHGHWTVSRVGTVTILLITYLSKWQSSWHFKWDEKSLCLLWTMDCFLILTVS